VASSIFTHSAMPLLGTRISSSSSGASGSRRSQAMPDFLTLTPNPALDLATTTARVEPTHKLRCGSLQRYPGGGGINVARVLHRLGHAVQAWHLSGGLAGAQLTARLAAEGGAGTLSADCGAKRGRTCRWWSKAPDRNTAS
jgi:sugar/nucleoside kinase (ribokinase family)